MRLEPDRNKLETSCDETRVRQEGTESDKSREETTWHEMRAI